MQERPKKFRRELNWRRIPAARRHFYVFALFVLGAMMGNEIKDAFTVSESQEPSSNTARIQAANIQSFSR